MAQAKKCDRCGSLYNVYHDRFKGKSVNGVVLVDYDAQGRNYYESHFYDLCPTCLNVLKGWIANED